MAVAVGEATLGDVGFGGMVNLKLYSALALEPIAAHRPAELARNRQPQRRAC